MGHLGLDRWIVCFSLEIISSTYPHLSQIRKTPPWFSILVYFVPLQFLHLNSKKDNSFSFILSLVGQPQFGHEVALSETLFPHSEHFIRAILLPHYYSIYIFIAS